MRRTPRFSRALCLAGWLAVVLSACDTTIVVVDSGGQGAGLSVTGQGATVVTGIDAGVGGAGVCGTPHPVPPLMSMGISSANATGGLEQCAWSVEDAVGRAWSAHCTIEECSCRFEGLEVCRCDYETPLSFCDAINSCCPAGWPSM